MLDVDWSIGGGDWERHTSALPVEEIKNEQITILFNKNDKF